MKFDAKTLDVLKNFSTINPSLKFEKGNVLKTISPIKTILSQAHVTTSIEETFVIGELGRFMSALSLFQDPEVILGEESLIITDGKDKLKYLYTPENVITLPPEKPIAFPAPDVQFTLTNEMFQTARKAMAVLSLQEMALIGEDGKLIVRAHDAKGLSKDTYSIPIGETDKKFSVVFKAENLKLMPFDYEVSISSKGISWFKNDDIQYWIAIESAYSKFE
jgi:gp45 sliding clamp, C terminal.